LGSDGEDISETDDDKSDDGWTLTTGADRGEAKRKTVLGIKISRPKKNKRVVLRNSVTNARGETIFRNETRLVTDEPMAVVHLPGGPVGVYEQKAKMFGVLGLFHEYLDELDD
jgi:hypothetical protein